ncbi:TetR/AcrR family transcriptional regulator [Phytoactinopolyspora endophytica]|uniref:TetR/AcrR family transcriptional regulator n=1 Tax=Phytoactinopolyspora endophytica TaxID=1642495 RepID=UPI0013EB73C2|nr:TetR/AcrR family transcriptional regulator [Phytoactinopolyspora endophytica]
MQTEQAEQGLRERKKAATRRALGEAALGLAMEHGVADVTVEAIAAAVDVSSRTFHNYFSSKEEAIVSVAADRIEDSVEALRSRPPEESNWDALETVMVEDLVGASGQGDPLAQFLFIHENAALLSQEMTAVKCAIDRFSQVVAERSGTDTARDMYPHLQAGAAMLCTRAALTAWFADPAADVVDLTRQAFAQLRAGLPEPQRDTGEP